MDSKTNNHKVYQSRVLPTKQSHHKMSRRERGKIINHIRRLSTIDEIEISPSIPLETTESNDNVTLIGSSPGKSIKNY